MSFIGARRFAFVFAFALAPSAVAGCTERPSEPVSSSAGSSSSQGSSGPSVSSAPAAPTGPAAPAPPALAGVPPLQPNESPPSSTPNYFEPTEMSAVGIGTAVDSCVAVISQGDSGAVLERSVQYCSCLADAWRINVHKASNPDNALRPTKEQQAKCRAAIDGASPYAFSFPKGTPDLYKAWKDCLGKNSEDDHGVFCGCFVDGTFKNPGNLGIMPPDQLRCTLADRYWVLSHTHLTPRQFAAIEVPDAGGRMPARAPAGPPQMQTPRPPLR